MGPRTPPGTRRKMLALSDEQGGCASCHAEDQVPPLPASGERRPDVLCRLCHSLAHEGQRQVPHSLSDRGTCDDCHAPDRLRALPYSHVTRTEKMCATCHNEWPGGGP